MATTIPARGKGRASSSRRSEHPTDGRRRRGGRAKHAHPFARTLKRVQSPSGEPSRGPASPAPSTREGRPPAALARQERVGEGREREHAPAPDRGEVALELPAAFRAMPVLQTPLEGSAPAAAGSGLERAQAAAMAERLLHSVRVGKVAGGHEVRLGIAGSRVEVRLRQEGDRLVPELHLADDASGADAATAERLAARLDTELRDAGLDFDPIAIRR